VNIDYDTIKGQRECSQALRVDLYLGAISFDVDDDGLEPDTDLPELWDKSASEVSDDSKGGNAMSEPFGESQLHCIRMVCGCRN